MENLLGKRLLVLGGSYCKDAIKKFSLEHGVELVAAGNDPTAEISLIADEYHNINTTDYDAMKQFIAQAKIDGVYLGSSEPVIGKAVSYVAECGFPCYCTKEQWTTIQNKAKLKELFIKFDIPVVPRYEISYDEIDALASGIDFPVITKPADGCGSSGFTVCYNAEDLKKGYLLAAENSASGEVMIEKYVNNQGVVAFFSFSNGKMLFLGMEDKYPRIYQEGGSYVAGLLVFESRFTQEVKAKFGDRLEKLFSHLGLKEGTVWIEIFHDKDNYYFNEAGYRYGGSATVYPIDYLYGVNQVYADMYFSLTGESKLFGHSTLLPEGTPKKKHYCIYPVYVKCGTIKSIQGIESLEQSEAVVKTVVTKHAGDFVKHTGGFSQNLALIHFLCDDAAELNDTIKLIHSTLKVTNENGEDMLTEPLDIKNTAVIL